ncbi:MAG TPA: hypothetical protein VLH41_03250 [Thermoanaerobaculia bacterium]|nr:hypothetical protein [Thermoanaerobaculia bacterium]
MKKTMGLIGTACLLVSAIPRAAAEEPPPPPKILQIFREEVKPGKAAAHEKVEAGWPRAFAKANWPTRYLALTSLTGPMEAWFAIGFDSFAAWEKDTKATEANKALSAELEKLSVADAECISGGRGLVAIHREDLGFGPNADISKTRYFRIITFKVRPGHDKDFTDAVKIVKDAYQKASVPITWAVYQVSGGMSGPTYLVWVPMRSLAETDAVLGAMKAIQEAEGDDGQKALTKMAADGYLSVEQNFFAVSPKMSYPPKAWVDKDPGFWAPKSEAAPPKPVAKPAEKK